MKRFISTFLLLPFILHIFPIVTQAAEPDLISESAILMEASTGQVIYEKNADKILRPASITKIMTLLLIYDAIDAGKISKSDTVTISEHAASMGGSQVFLEPGEVQTVETLIKCIAIASANDASVAMAEYVCGTEALFVENMNEKARALDMNNTNFVNACGLDADGHLTTARDVAIMSRELINKYPEIHNISTIWMDTIIHVTRRGESEFTLTNTNKLIKQYEWATGLKTGSTSQAGFCLSATANKDGVELISVVMAAPTSKIRLSDSINLLNYGYGSCSMYEDKEMPPLKKIAVKGSMKKNITCEYSGNFTYLFTEQYDLNLITSQTEFLDNLSAPVKKGDVIGQRIYYYNSSPIGAVDITASEDVKKSGYKDYASLILRSLFK